MLLKPLPSQLEQAAAPVIVPAPVACENCGAVVERRDQAINFIAVIGSPGHPELAAFQCAHTEHWACSIDCWVIIAHACIDEHLSAMLKLKHREVNQ
jgi:hypothetical protein